MKFCEPCAKLIAEKVNVPTIVFTGEFDNRCKCDYCGTENTLCAGRHQPNQGVRVVRRDMRKQGGFAMTMALYLIGAVAVVAVLYGVYWKIDHSWETTAGIEKGRKEIQDKWNAAVAEQRAKEAKQIDTATTKLEKANVKAKVVYRTITQNVDRVVTRDVYRNVCLDSDGLQYVNAAIRGPSDPPRDTDKPMPKPDATRGRDGLGGASQADRNK